MGRCFSHILENGLLHSSEAITLYHSDKTGRLWHQQHSEARSKREEAWSTVKQAEEKGSRPDVDHMLAYLATKFVTCKPIKPAHTRHGWYDKNVLVARMPAYALDATRPQNVKTSTEIYSADGSVNSRNNSLNNANVEFEPLTNDDHMHVLSPVAVAVDPSSTRPYVRASTPVTISSSSSKKRTRAVLDCVYISADRAAVGKRSSIDPPRCITSSSIPAALARVEDEEMVCD
ncbi:hypothetical protein SERLA73DRAFT_189884 [Serpula lacrymans var. lacrymans S7.3]|uniref:Uncharacterized protein n=2 Tax=Serpula lacrymans var. lacrymans TaxID=341189 RepID=F8QER0_SERL3|nr:hypothetical protein SERLA73DRAFT_189884 [Serpula lacrymans var. lacrymans S7.3]